MSDGPIPCPFCGGSGLHYVPREIADHPPLDLDGDLSICQTGERWWCVQCGCCGATGPRVWAGRDKACPKAIAAWNRRTLWAQARVTEEENEG